MLEASLQVIDGPQVSRLVIGDHQVGEVLECYPPFSVLKARLQIAGGGLFIGSLCGLPNQLAPAILGDPPEFAALEDTHLAGHRCPPGVRRSIPFALWRVVTPIGLKGPIRRIKYSIGVLPSRPIAATVPRLARARPSSSQWYMVPRETLSFFAATEIPSMTTLALPSRPFFDRPDGDLRDCEAEREEAPSIVDSECLRATIYGQAAQR